MRPPLRDSGRRSVIDTNMTPMIDVIFQLQIFFLCTAGFALPESILPTQLPATGAATAPALADPIDLEIVRIRLRGNENNLNIALNDRHIASVGELRQEISRLGAISTALPIVLDIGSEVVLGTVIDVYDACLSAAMTKINFAASKVKQ